MEAAQLMIPKERWLAATHMRPVDRLPFWPKLDAAYPRAQAGSTTGTRPEPEGRACLEHRVASL